MGKRIISQARGRGGPTYRVRRKAFMYKLKIPAKVTGDATVIKIFNSTGHNAPIAKLKSQNSEFYIPAFRNMFEGQTIKIGKGEAQTGNILKLKDIPLTTQIYNIESRPGDGGKFIRSSGSSAVVSRIVGNDVYVKMPSKKEKRFNQNSRAIIGVVAGKGRVEKPLIKAGKRYKIKKAKGKLYPRTSAIKVNVIDHPFGSGRGKVPKSKIAKRNAPPGARVGLIRPRRTGKRK